MSHELRTPVAALQAVLENVVDGVTPADPATLRAALAQVERLGVLVRELLDLSRVDAGHVPLRRQDVRRLARLSVADDGPGIPHTEREHVFERSTRGRTSGPHDGGTGLGLAIARWAVDLHGGRIAVADTGRGRAAARALLTRPELRLAGLAAGCW